MERERGEREREREREREGDGGELTDNSITIDINVDSAPLECQAAQSTPRKQMDDCDQRK